MLHFVASSELNIQLGWFGLAGTLALKPISTLSGGEKSRLVFATIMVRRPHIILLDEPSNFLDFATIIALRECINNFTGACILVSHDQLLLESFSTLLLVDDQVPPSTGEDEGGGGGGPASPVKSAQSRSRVRNLRISFDEYRARLRN